jgi:hypothetical protein
MKISDERGFSLYDGGGYKFNYLNYTVRELFQIAEHLAKQKLFTELVNSGHIRLWSKMDYRDNPEAFIFFEVKGEPTKSSCCG